MPLTRKSLVVTGRVQGVGFRWFAAEAARACRVTGWVRNLPDGSVEAQVQGSAAALKGFVSALRKGPSYAAVASVEERDLPICNDETDFDIR